jgi:TRAP-type C4-dicarboxylate transport system permease small subunit
MERSAALRLDRVTRTIAMIGFCGLVVMALLIFYDGAARSLDAPRISGFSDYGEVIFPLVIASCFPAGLLRQTNVTVRVLGSIGGHRMNAALELFAALVTLAFFTVLVWQFVVLTGNYGGGGRTTRTIGIPLAPWWWGTTAIMALCIPVQAFVAWSWLRAFLSGEAPVISAIGHDPLAESEAA